MEETKKIEELKKPEKASNLQAMDTEKQLIEVINNSNLMAFVLKPIMERIYKQLETIEQEQLKAAQLEYEVAEKKYQEKVNSEKKGDKDGTAKQN